jgi:hypothetical protein
MKIFLSFTLLLLLFLTGCETTPAVQSASGPDFDPANYDTFAILEPQDNPLAPAAPALFRTAMMVMSTSLKKKGLEEAEVEAADLVFQATGGSMPMVNASQYGFVWVGDWAYWYPATYRRSSMNSKNYGIVVVSAFDNESKELVWQAMSGSSSNTSAYSTQRAMDSLKEVMKKYPKK